MSVLLAIRVYGRPAPEGSHEVGQHGYVMHSSKYLKAWRAAVDRDTRRAYVEAGLTKADMPLVPYPQPVYIHSIELLVGPDQCRAEGTDEPTGPPDLDKLLRATIDGLGEARVFGNDSQVTKVYELGKRRDPEPGAVIIISDEPPVRASRGETDMTEYRISIERVIGQDDEGYRKYAGVFELHGTAEQIVTAGLTTAGAVLGAGEISVALPEQRETAPATAPAEPSKPRGRRKSTPAAEPATEAPAAPAEPAAAEPVTSGGAESSPVAPEPAAAPAAPPAPAAPVNPFARG